METFHAQAHQGDVYLRRITELPANVAPVAPVNGRVVVALGETSGHHHSLAGPHVAMFRDDGGGSGGMFYLRVDAPTALEHLTGGNTPTHEHDAILVAPGLYALPPQQQWTDADEPIRVAD